MEGGRERERERGREGEREVLNHVLFLQDVGPAQPGSEEDWLAGLALFLPEVGIETALVQETLAKLRESGATEHQLRNSVTAAELKEMGILLGPRYATPDACNSRIVPSHGPLHGVRLSNRA